MKFQEGQEVWVYDPPLLMEGTIRVVTEFGSQCDFPHKLFDFLKGKLYSNHQLFARPSDWSELVDRLRDDTETLTAAAEKLERENRE